MSRHPILPGCSQSHPGTHGLPLRHAPASGPKGNLLGSSALPVQLHMDGSSTSPLIVSDGKVRRGLQHERNWKMLFYNSVIVTKELNKWLSAVCWSDRASLLTLLDKRLIKVWETTCYEKKGKGRHWFSPASQINGCFFWCWLELSSQYLSPLLLFCLSCSYRVKFGCSSWIASASNKSSWASASVTFLRLPEEKSGMLYLADSSIDTSKGLFSWCQCIWVKPETLILQLWVSPSSISKWQCCDRNASAVRQKVSIKQ